MTDSTTRRRTLFVFEPLLATRACFVAGHSMRFIISPTDGERDCKRVWYVRCRDASCLPLQRRFSTTEMMHQASTQAVACASVACSRLRLAVVYPSTGGGCRVFRQGQRRFLAMSDSPTSTSRSTLGTSVISHIRSHTMYAR